MNNTGSQENILPITAQMSLTTDYVRTIVGGISARMNLTNLAALISGLISSSVLKNKIRTVVANTAILIEDNTILADCTTGNISLTLPSPTSAFDATNNLTNSFTISQKIDAGNTATILPNVAESIFDGSAQTSIILSGGSSVTIETDGTNWTVVSS